eukprot:tig00021070_g17874.t1
MAFSTACIFAASPRVAPALRSLASARPVAARVLRAAPAVSFETSSPRRTFHVRCEGETPAAAPAAAPAEAPAAPAAPATKPVDVTRLNLRVGKIVKAWPHPDADSLYCEEIDIGEEAPRLICSGLRNYVPLEEFEGSMVIVLANLKPRKMRGIESNGMVLAASNEDHSQVELIKPPEGAQPGERVSFEGYEGPADDVLNPKKKVWEAIQPDMRTTADGVAAYKGIPFTTSAGPVTVQNLKNCSIG